MGFGKKTDFETGRVLDLDATFEAIIKPASEANDLRVIRGDEIMHSGIIDSHMYDMLLRADLVIADISTGNANAVYELGVRHALRPHSTIVMKDNKGRFYFDLNHVATFGYDHLGEDIGAREAQRASSALEKLIQAVLATPTPDSPVYTYLPKLQSPQLTDADYALLLNAAEANEKALSGFIKSGNDATRASDHGTAIRAYREALAIKPGDPFLLQQLSLNTYKSKHPSAQEALRQALAIIEELTPDDSNDPETVGICGAIHKRLWSLTGDQTELEAAISFYRRGFEIRRDYYNGENLATCLAMRSKNQATPEEATYDRTYSRKVREQLFDLLTKVVKSADFRERSDKKWIFATFANISSALGRASDAARYERLFYGEQPVQWESNTYEEGKRAIEAEQLAPTSAIS